MSKQKNTIERLFSEENIKYSLIFLILSIIFSCFFPDPLLLSFSKWATSLSKEMIYIYPIIVWLILILTFTPYVVFIYERKYEIFILGLLIPFLIVNIYTYYVLGLSLDTFRTEWFFWNPLPSFILIYFLRRSKNLKEDLISIIFFVLLSEVLCITLSIYYGTYSSADPFAYMPLVLFATVYLILLSFVIEKIAKIKIFRRSS